MELYLNEVAEFTRGQIDGGNIRLSGIATDSRKIKQGDLFVALRGEKFDGHNYIKDAERKGAAAFLVEENMKLSLPTVKVKNARKSLGNIAKGLREKFKGTVIGITGSNGKTTVKELVSTILNKKFKVLSTYGNLNNDIGVPLTLFKLLQDNYDVIVVEMGSNQVGEIKYLTKIVQPNIATITNIGHAHLDGFNCIDGVLQEKSKIFEKVEGSINSLRHAVFNLNDDKNSLLTNISKGKGITFGEDLDADIYFNKFSEVVEDEKGCQWKEFNLEVKKESLALKTILLGRHNIINIQASIATVLSLGVEFEDIQAAVSEFQGVSGRLQIQQGLNNCTVIDDTYNANIDSLKPAIDVLCSLEKKKILILGGMDELGDISEDMHIQAGCYAKNSGVDLLIGCGSEVELTCLEFGAGSQYFSTTDALVAEIFSERLVIHNAAILVKGSRSSAMEKVVDVLQGRSECCLH